MSSESDNMSLKYNNFKLLIIGMSSFYQSEVRKTIQETIYQKPVFTIELFGKTYFGTIKTKKIIGITFNRYQILGINIPEDKEAIQKEISKIQNQFWKKNKNIFFQRWITNEIVSFDIKDFVCQEFANDLREGRCFLRTLMKKKYSLLHAFRENMPESWIVYDLSKTDEELLREMNKASNLRTKKGIKQDIWFGEAEENEFEEFYKKRWKTADKKGFNIIPQNEYKKLIAYLKNKNKGNLFVTRQNGEILAGAIGIYHQKSIICLYSFADRNHTNMGGQQYLKFKIFWRGRDNGFTVCDMMWGAPTGFPEHELASLSAFKESMGGTKIEYYGNYDIILNKRRYKVFKRRYKIKK